MSDEKKEHGDARLPDGTRIADLPQATPEDIAEVAAAAKRSAIEATERFASELKAIDGPWGVKIHAAALRFLGDLKEIVEEKTGVVLDSPYTKAAAEAAEEYLALVYQDMERSFGEESALAAFARSGLATMAHVAILHPDLLPKLGLVAEGRPDFTKKPHKEELKS